MASILKERGQQTLPIKGQIVNILGFEGLKLVVTYGLCNDQLTPIL